MQRSTLCIQLHSTFYILPRGIPDLKYPALYDDALRNILQALGLNSSDRYNGAADHCINCIFM